VTVAAEILAIADAVVAALNGHTFSAPYNAPLGAVRAYVPVYELEDLAALKVTVVPRGVSGELAVIARDRRRQMGYQVDVAAQKRVEGMNPADIDALVLLGEEVADFLFKTPLTGVTPSAVMLLPTVVPDADQLEQLHTVTVVASVTYRSFR
jgi:hypothetical protein